MKILSTFLVLATAQGTAPVDEKCPLYIVQCDVDDGWTILVNETCRQNEYDWLNIEGRPQDFFIGNKTLDKQATTPPVDPECYFDGNLTYPQVIQNLGFDKCGGFPFTPGLKPGDLSVYTGWINNRVKISGVETSEMDEFKVQCQFSDVDLKSKAQNIEEGDEKDIIKKLSSAELVSALDLALQIQQNGSPVPQGGNVTVGSRVTTKLLFDPSTDYLFQLKGCGAFATIDGTKREVPFYTTRDNYCPNQDVGPILGVKWVDYISFYLNVFRISNADTLTFACYVTVFEPGSTKRINCNDPPTGRRRRDADDTATTIEIIKTVNISDEDKNIAGSGALQTCANIIVPSIFFMAFL